MIATIDINFVRMSNKIVWKYLKNHIFSCNCFFGLDKSVLSKCKFCAMFYLAEFDDKKNSLSEGNLLHPSLRSLSLLPKGLLWAVLAPATQKSVNLQYITLGWWDKWIVDQESDVPSIFYTLYRLRTLKTIYFYFCNFI